MVRVFVQALLEHTDKLEEQAKIELVKKLIDILLQGPDIELGWICSVQYQYSYDRFRRHIDREIGTMNKFSMFIFYGNSLGILAEIARSIEWAIPNWFEDLTKIIKHLKTKLNKKKWKTLEED